MLAALITIAAIPAIGRSAARRPATVASTAGAESPADHDLSTVGGETAGRRLPDPGWFPATIATLPARSPF